MHTAKDAWEGRLQTLRMQLTETKEEWQAAVASHREEAAAQVAATAKAAQDDHAIVIRSLKNQYAASVAELKEVRLWPSGPRAPSVLFVAQLPASDAHVLYVLFLACNEL